ncbi:RluA family pseudouridine synthase [uncultured Psychrobacter sp.]|uniref:RluA family pseudouridine synthase n=1 Tax=uncultured Psychrobacter sp. TaxID=259303 RepID=UPI002593905A|nr:RluA family pseudouridine synthase [uncultured Psychrobacter sp.]
MTNSKMPTEQPIHEAPAIFNSKTRPQSADDEISNFEKVNYLEVTRHQHDQRLDNFLLNRLKGLPKSHIYKMIRSDEVRVNNKRCKAHDRLQREDVVRIAPVQLATRDKPIVSAEFANSLLARVVYEDEGLIVLNKPAGIAVHGGSGLDFGVIEAMREVTGKKYLELIHRIDKDTSGLLMISKKRSALKVLQQHLVDRTIQKHYLCLAKGQPALNEQRIDAPLLRYTLTSGERRVKVDAQDPQAKESQTDIIVHGRFTLNDQPVSLLEAKPLTGRTHQIRVHLAHIGHAILGDDKYNVHDKSGVHRLCLHAWRLDIPGYETITAPLPDEMKDWLPADMQLPE